ncbi:MAG TPA: DUF3173 family protein [Pseudogracilibacillus sp.]|nr:DUF3173 family protein [Pseudogracilibacillus sp.]
MKQVINKQDLIALGFTEYQSQNIIRQAKIYMIDLGYDLYDNKKIATVPLKAIKSILGFEQDLKKGADNYGEENQI